MRVWVSLPLLAAGCRPAADGLLVVDCVPPCAADLLLARDREHLAPSCTCGSGVQTFLGPSRCEQPDVFDQCDASMNNPTRALVWAAPSPAN